MNKPTCRTTNFAQGKVVVLNGFPGTGKFTILRHLQDHSWRGKTWSRLIDNHLLIDPVQAVYPDRGHAHYQLRRQMRDIVFSSLREVVREGHLILMTACLADNEVDRQVLKEHLDLVRDTNIPLYWINVHCDLGVLEQRATSIERVQGTKRKLTNLQTLRKLVDENQLIRPSITENMNLVTKSLDVSGSIGEAVTGVEIIITDSEPFTQYHSP
ncbi:hypothetical protein BKA56DRAFT_667766 [Ilyonectria sp. MPI-CAGE-AT-0026]|nr:hypothetical protein BKA56DRAFT_667766 [Ilyonectria sp. MPI-CAGE-AT-0026]